MYVSTYIHAYAPVNQITLETRVETVMHQSSLGLSVNTLSWYCYHWEQHQPSTVGIASIGSVQA